MRGSKNISRECKFSFSNKFFFCKKSMIKKGKKTTNLRAVASTSSFELSLPAKTAATTRTESTTTSSTSTPRSTAASSSFEESSFPFSSLFIRRVGITLRTISSTESAAESTASPLSWSVVITVSSLARTVCQTSVFLVFSPHIAFTATTSPAICSFCTKFQI